MGRQLVSGYLSVVFVFHTKLNIPFSLSICCVVVFLRLCITFVGMKSCRLRAIPCQVTQKKRATKPRIPLKPIWHLHFVTMRIYLIFSVIHFFNSVIGLAKVYSIGLNEPVHFSSPSNSRIPSVRRILYSSAFPLNILFDDNSLSTNN